MTRFAGGAHPPTDLGAVLYDDFGALRAERLAMDARIEAFMANLPRDCAAGTIRYVSSAGLTSEDPLDVLLPHFFNHQTPSPRPGPHAAAAALATPADARSAPRAPA